MNESNIYKPRVSDIILQRKLSGKGAVLVEGPKWCGKTTTAKQQAASMLDLGDPAELERSEITLSINSAALLDGETPRLIDEWQTIPQLWDIVRNQVDKRNSFGQFILTGSSVPPENSKNGKQQIHHTGNGRIARMRMRPMSLWESGESSGKISLEALFRGEIPQMVPNDTKLEDIAYLICRGGWPQATMLEGDIALEQAFDYYKIVTEYDIQRVDGVKRSPERARQIMRSYARNQGHQTPYSTICADILQNDSRTITDDTVVDYVDALRMLYVIEDMHCWNPNLRSKAAIRQSDNRYFVDPSIAVAALGVGPGDLMNDLKAMGMFFESLAVRDLRVYADALNGEVLHYRDSNGLECDTVVHLRNGDYGLIEIKLGGKAKIEEGAKNLRDLAKILDTDRMKAPSFMMVLTAVSPFAYRREEDGVLVVPLSCLKV